MMTSDWWILALLVGALLLLAPPLGAYLARVFEGRPCGLDRVLGPLERLFYRAAGVDPQREMPWKRYALAMLLFNAAGLVVLFLLQVLQGALPGNPEGMAGVAPDLAFNTAVSFVTNTNWQAYGGETTMSYLTQAMGLTVQNFLSAATGIAIAVAVVRGFARRETDRIGNFWVDLVRTTLYVLLPLAFVLAVVLVSEGVVQTLAPSAHVALLDPTIGADGAPVREQVIALGPAASQIAIKQLGTNGGGFFNVNSAHPFENPTALANFLELLAILLVAAALPFTFGRMVGDRRQGRALFAAMLLLFLPFAVATPLAEVSGNPAIEAVGVDTTPSALQPGGNMEGKEVRFGPIGSGLWAATTTAASNGSVNAMHDSFTPLGGFAPLFLMQLGEIVFGGVGSGLYGMLAFALVAVFVAGLMVGRTPEYLGKKVEAFEMTMAAVVILVPAALVLLGTALGVSLETGRAGIANPGAHGFSEILYAFTSAANNNGSAFAGLTVNTPFYNLVLGFAMLVGRFGVAVPMLAVAGSLAAKRPAPPSAGTLATHGPLFVALVVFTILLVGALNFVPALALGPIVEHLQMVGG